jgi:hypothetical protein
MLDDVTTRASKDRVEPTSMTRPDALIITALQDELDAVLALGERGRGGWQAAPDCVARCGICAGLSHPSAT